MSTKTEAPDDTDVGHLVDRFMGHIHCDLGCKAPTSDPEKVGPAGGFVLMAIGDLEPAPIYERVQSVARDKAQMTRLLQSRGKKGVVHKTRSAEDGRVCVLELTPRGREFVAG